MTIFIGIAIINPVSERVGNSSLTGLKHGYSFKLHKSLWLKGKKRVDSVWIFSSKAPVFPLFLTLDAYHVTLRLKTIR